MLTNELRGNFKPFKRIPDAKGAQGSNLARDAREDTLASLLMEEVRQMKALLARAK